jgi:hypothetical protein
MTLYPLYEILFFIALFFAPEGAKKFEIIKECDNPILFNSTSQGWINVTEQMIWVEENYTVTHGSESHDVSSYVEGISPHHWSEENILHLRMMDVLKTKNSLIIYPNGIDYPKNKYSIIYKTEANKSE